MFWHSSFVLAFGYNLEQWLGSQIAISMHEKQNQDDGALIHAKGYISLTLQQPARSPKAHFCTQ